MQSRLAWTLRHRELMSLARSLGLARLVFRVQKIVELAMRMSIIAPRLE